MKKKILAMMLVGAMAVMSLAGCGKSSSSSSAGGEATTAAENSTEASKDSPKNITNKDAKYHIGILQLVQHPALDAASKGFEDALVDEFGKDVDIEYQNASGDSPTCSTIANTFVQNKKDLILANATPALQAAVGATSDIPILGTSITDYATALDMKNWNGTTGINVSGTSDLAPLDQQADLLEQLFPADNYKNVGILYCNAEANSAYQSRVITEALKKKGYSVKEYKFSDTNDVASVTTNAAQSSDVLYIPTDNTAASCTDTIRPILLQAKKAAVVGEEGICKGCGVATLSINYYELGYQTGKQAVDILKNGSDVSKMEVKTADKVTKEYNKELADELGVEIPDDFTAIDTSEK